jgi:hypothetical protein
MIGAYDPIMKTDAGPELRHLRALRAVAEEGSFAEAAAVLGCSQPAVSQQMEPAPSHATWDMCRGGPSRHPKLGVRDTLWHASRGGRPRCTAWYLCRK